MADIDYSHQDFDVVRTDERFGGFEELKLKDGSSHTRFFRKAVTPGNHSQLEEVSELESCIMKDGLSGTVHPVYEHDGKKWILLSVPEVHYSATSLSLDPGTRRI